MGCFKYSFCSNSTNLENAKKKSGYMIYYLVVLYQRWDGTRVIPIKSIYRLLKLY